MGHFILFLFCDMTLCSKKWLTILGDKGFHLAFDTTLAQTDIILHPQRERTMEILNSRDTVYCQKQTASCNSLCFYFKPKLN